MKKLWGALLMLVLVPCVVQGGTLNLQCAASNQDAFENVVGGDMSISTNLIFGYSGGLARHGGMYFSGVSGLAGTTITAATLTFVALTTDAGTDMVGDWYADDLASPAVFTITTSDISSRARTTATCEGDGTDFGSWTAEGTPTFTGDGVNTIAGIIQELATSYNPTAIVLMWMSASGTARRVPYSWDNNTSKAAKLDITYSAAASGPSSITSVAGTGTITGWCGTSWSNLTKWCRP